MALGRRRVGPALLAPLRLDAVVKQGPVDEGAEELLELLTEELCSSPDAVAHMHAPRVGSPHSPTAADGDALCHAAPRLHPTLQSGGAVTEVRVFSVLDGDGPWAVGGAVGGAGHGTCLDGVPVNAHVSPLNTGTLASSSFLRQPSFSLPSSPSMARARSVRRLPPISSPHTALLGSATCYNSPVSSPPGGGAGARRLPRVGDGAASARALDSHRQVGDSDGSPGEAAPSTSRLHHKRVGSDADASPYAGHATSPYAGHGSAGYAGSPASNASSDTPVSSARARRLGLVRARNVLDDALRKG
jgi:hypothetical protein